MRWHQVTHVLFSKNCLFGWIPEADASLPAPSNASLLFLISDYYYCNPILILNTYRALLFTSNFSPYVAPRSHSPIIIIIILLLIQLLQFFPLRDKLPG